MAKPSYTAEEAGAQVIRDGYSWGYTQGDPVTVTYAFRDDRPAYNNTSNVYGTFSQFNSVQIAAATTALELWSDVANITFVPEGTGSAPYGETASILFGNYRANDGAAAFAYLPSPSRTDGHGAQGDVWVNRYYGDFTPYDGNYANLALIHEIGHAIGLGHPGDYDAMAGVSITYSNSAEYVQDTRQYSVMSYFDAGYTGADHGGVYASTPLMHDIVALQMLYGANYDTRSGDTTYGFGSNAGAAYALNGMYDVAVFSVWDGGGEDTFDFSGYDVAQLIDLREGSFSDVGGLTRNVSIAPGAIVENAIGGSGSDTIYGNDAANYIHGGAGKDAIRGGAGNDILDGSYGKDWIFGGAGDDTIFGGNGCNFLAGNAGDDTITGGIHNEKIKGGDDNDTIYGGAGKDEIYGGAGNDILDGSLGKDWIYGGDGDDTIIGGNGYNFLFGNAGDDTITGGVHAEIIKGGAGDDRIYGGGGNDLIRGGDGNDMITGGLHLDVISGGSGADTFVFEDVMDSSPGSMRDAIQDFGDGADLIDLQLIDANTQIDGDQAFTWIGQSAFSGTAGELRYRTPGSFAVIQADVDGDGRPDLAIQLSNLSVLNSDDFLL